jgi:hypothetical protein
MTRSGGIADNIEQPHSHPAPVRPHWFETLARGVLPAIQRLGSATIRGAGL